MRSGAEYDFAGGVGDFYKKNAVGNASINNLFGCAVVFLCGFFGGQIVRYVFFLAGRKWFDGMCIVR